MNTNQPGPSHNALLALVPVRDLDRLRPLFTRVEFKPKQVLHHRRMPMEHVYFIESGLVSVSARIDSEAFVEVWLTGSEGMTGVPVVHGDDDDPPHRQVVQVGGWGLRISAADLRKAIRDIPSLRAVLLRYAQVVLIQTSQSGVCNAHHEVKKRIARWLLLSRDGLGADEIPLTHDVLGRLLGVRRASVSEYLTILESEGCLELSRSMIRIRDSTKLETTSCECYRIISREQRRLLSQGARGGSGRS